MKIINILLIFCIIGLLYSIRSYYKKEALVELSNFIILENYIVSSKTKSKEVNKNFPYIHRELLRFSPQYKKYFSIVDVYTIYKNLKKEGKLYYYDE